MDRTVSILVIGGRVDGTALRHHLTLTEPAFDPENEELAD